MELNKKWLKTLRQQQSFLFEWKLGNKKIIASELMIQPIYLRLNDTIEVILNKLQSEEINYCIVVDDDRKFIWGITDEMLLKIIAHTSINEPLVKILDIWYKRGINYTHAKDYVKKHKNTVTAQTPLYDIMKLIDKKWFQFIPVVDEEKKVIWLITPSSVLRFIFNR